MNTSSPILPNCYFSAWCDKIPNKATLRRAYFGSQLKGTVYHGGEGQAARARGSCNTVCIFFLSFSPGPQHGIVTPTYGNLPTSVKPQTHFRGLGSGVILSLTKPVFKMHHQIDKVLKFFLTPIPNTLLSCL